MRRQVAVGGRDHAHAHADDLLAAHAVELALLQHAQQLGLRRAVQVAHFVQEDGAAVGQLELAAPRGGGAGERALLVPEQLGLDQLGGNGRAVHLHERARRRTGWSCGCAPPAAPCRCPIRRSAARAHPTAPPWWPAPPRAARPGWRRSSSARRPPARAAARFPAAGVACSRAFFTRQQHAVAAQRLLQEIEGAGARGLHRVGDGAVAGNHDGRRGGAVLPHRLAAGRCRCRPAASCRAGRRRRAARRDGGRTPPPIRQTFTA